MDKQGLLFIIVGPSGAGKNTLMDELLHSSEALNLRQMATMTTRGPRAGETEGIQHYFVSEKDFWALEQEGGLVEYQQIHNDFYYGTPRFAIEKAIASHQNLIADIDVKGAIKLKAAYPDHTVLIFIAPPSREVLESRLKSRDSESAEQIQIRLSRAEMEMAYIPQFDYLIVNDNLGHSIQLLRQIIQAKYEGRPVKEMVRLYARAWITAADLSDSVLCEQGELPLVHLGQHQDELIHILEQRLNLALSADLDICKTLWLGMDETGQLNGELFLRGVALNQPPAAEWCNPSDLDLPFHLCVTQGVQAQPIPQ